MAANDRDNKENRIEAVDIQAETYVADPIEGSVEARIGDVFIVGREISLEDAGYLVAAKMAKPCAAALKVQREKEKAKAAKQVTE